MIFRDYIRILTVVFLALFVFTAHAQDLLDDESEAASEDLLLDSALNGDLLVDETLLAEDDLDSLDLDLELPVEEPLGENLVLDTGLGDLIEEPADSEFDLSDIEEPMIEEPLIEEPMLEEPLIEEPVLDEPVLEEPLIEEPVLEEPMLEEPLLEEPVLEEPVLEEPLIEEPVLEEPVLDDGIDFNALVEETLEDSKDADGGNVHIPPATTDVAPVTSALVVNHQDDEMVRTEIMQAIGEGIPAPPSIEGIEIEGLGELLFTENLAILKREAGEHHAVDQLDEAGIAYSEGDYDKAIARYKYAYSNLGRRPATGADKKRAKIGVAKSYYAKAIQRYRAGEEDPALEAARLARDYGHPKANKLIKMISDGPIQDKVAAAGFNRQPVVNTEESKLRVQRISDLLWLGRQRFQARQYEDSLKAFEAVLTVEPENTEAIRMRYKLGMMKFDRSSLELEATREMMTAMVRETWNPRHYIELDAAAMTIETGPGRGRSTRDNRRDKILKKMNSIMIPEIDFRQANINDVVSFLAQMSQEFDTTELEPGDMRGVNIILNLGVKDGGGAADEGFAAAPVEDDPFAAMDAGFGNSGGAAAAAAHGDIPLVTFQARELTLLDALKIVTEYCNLKYHIKGSVVMIVRKNYTTEEIIPRWYSVMNFTDIMNESAVSMAAGGGGGGGGGGDFTAIDGGDIGGGGGAGNWKAFFEGLGVPWPQGSAIKYLPGIGKLMVANTAENLALFEQILNQFDFVPKQIEIEARFVEINQSDLESLGIEWSLTDDWEMLSRKGDAHMPISARPAIKMSAHNASAGESLTVGNRFLTGGALGAGINDNIMRIASVLTNPELDFVLHMMKQKGNSDLLSAPKVTAQSGSEATIKVVEEYIYPTEFTVSGVTGQTSAGGGGGGMSGAVVEPGGFETREVGVLLSVLPEVSAEGQMIMLTLSPEVCEFVRWEEYGSTFTDANGALQQLRMPQPIFHTRNVSTQIMIFNGATVVMGGMITESRISVDDKIPFLGDIPIIGRLFSSRYDQSIKRNLLVFVTARMVTPDGRPVKTAEEMNPQLSLTNPNN